ncbi:MAG: 4a-hydroxytetrahydrobiopterin dehydratase [Aquificaceae bacterium]|jgi:4a-hydroxytetrahydrobiopterin dehydratase|uniref:4a-hydroxytetrahydrobiopterin dehydratase n=1 Tax=Hydrogenobacter sp. Uz 6-8 TaxID=3384828 RepID=UPI000F2CDFDD|nr:MAG: 4a-hydroxytetrahydrobiopterin dehydratase [Aquificota bacterium]
MSGKGELKVYSAQEIESKLKGLPGWAFEEGFIVREYSTKNWKETVFLFNAIASLAEAHWHHPDVEAGFKKIRVKLTTHEAGGITDRDFSLAEEIEKISSLLLKR